MAEMEHYPNFQKDNYIHPKAAWDKLRMAGARRQNVYLYAATGYGKTELLHRYLRRRRHIWLSGEGLTVETLQEIALPAEATMVIDDLARVLDPAVRRAESYHFVRLFCREGAALLPLLQELGCPEGVDEAYWQEVLGKTRTMAEAYPLYLSTNAPAALPGAVQLSERALQVLRLQDRGLTRSEIARQLQLSERSVKYQCEQAYHKLGTSNKVEALAAARKLNLL